MTTISAPTVRTHARSTATTTFERVLLTTAATLDRYVAARLERRSGAESRRALTVQETAVARRRDAAARAAIGILPR